ncbi:MAG: putative metal-dependent hydrolase [Paracoccaceae bacterium]|jgi:predicted metal-dependent hydrolase
MNSSKTTLTISDLSVELVRKDIRNVHLSVLPPDGRVRLSAPQNMTDDNARLAIVTRWRWIKKKQKEYLSQSREPFREYVDGESHYFNGNRYLLSVVNAQRSTKLAIAGNGRIELHCREDASHSARQKAFDSFYRQHLNELLQQTVPKWCEALNVDQPEIRIQRMRTKWGSCNPKNGRIMVNLELAKKPLRCVEYIIAHEVVHLRVRHHSAEFIALLETVMPDWRHHKDVLNSLPLAYDKWTY